MLEKKFWVYILTNKHCTVLYTGMTSDIYKRVEEHVSGSVGSSFSKRYNVKHLVWSEEFSSSTDAIAAEKRLKGGSRKKKMQLIESQNPEWKDLMTGELLKGIASSSQSSSSQ